MADANAKTTELRKVGEKLLGHTVEMRGHILPQLSDPPAEWQDLKQKNIGFSRIIEQTDALGHKILSWLERAGSSECGSVKQYQLSRFSAANLTPGPQLVVQHFERCFTEWERALRSEIEFWPVRPSEVLDRFDDHLATDEKRRRRGRPKDVLRQHRIAKIRRVIERGLRGIDYVKALKNDAGLKTPLPWQHNENCPAEYLDAWNHQNPTERKKWRNRIAAERSNVERAAIADVELPVHKKSRAAKTIS